MPQHLQGLHVRKVGNMQAIISQYDIHATAALLARHTKQMHGGIIEPHEIDHLFRFITADKVGVCRDLHREAAASKIKAAPDMISLDVRKET